MRLNWFEFLDLRQSAPLALFQPCGLLAQTLVHGESLSLRLPFLRLAFPLTLRPFVGGVAEQAPGAQSVLAGERGVWRCASSRRNVGTCDRRAAESPLELVARTPSASPPWLGWASGGGRRMALGGRSGKAGSPCENLGCGPVRHRRRQSEPGSGLCSRASTSRGSARDSASECRACRSRPSSACARLSSAAACSRRDRDARWRTRGTYLGRCR